MEWKFSYRNNHERKVINLDLVESENAIQKQISQELNVKPSLLTLQYNNKEFQIDELRNNCNCTIMVYLKVEVFRYTDVVKNIHSFLSEYDETIYDLKLKYHMKFNVTDVIFDNGRLCSDKEYLRNRMECYGNVFCAFDRISITFINECGDVCVVKAYENDNFKSIKLDLMNNNFLNESQSKLMKNNILLSDLYMLGTYKTIEPYIVIVGFKILVVYDTYTCMYINDIYVNFKMQIKRLKEIISGQLCYDANLISLLKDSKTMIDENTVGDYKIKCGDFIEVLMKIFILYENIDKRVDFIIKRRYKIIDLKRKLSGKFQIDTNNIVLLLGNEELKNETQIDSLKEVNDATLLMKVCAPERNTMNQLSSDYNSSMMNLAIIDQLNCCERHIISVNKGCSIDRLQKEVAQKLSIGLCGINVYSQDCLLNGGTLDDYGIIDGYILTLKRKNFNIKAGEQFELKIAQRGHNLQRLLINEFETIRSLKLILREQHNVNVNRIILFYGDRELRDNEVIVDIDCLDNGSTIAMAIAEEDRSNERIISLKVRNNLTKVNDIIEQVVSVSEYEKIENLKNHLNTILDLCPDDDYVISFNGEILKAGNRIRTYDIGDSDEIVISHSLLVRYMAGECNNTAKVMRYAFMPGDKVSDLKMRITKKIGLVGELINICFDGRLMEDADLLEEYGIENDSYIIMVAMLSGG